VTSLVATLVTVFVSLCGLAAVLYLLIDGRFGGAFLSLLVTTGFELIIPLLVPPTDVVFFTDKALTARALEIVQVGRPFLPVDRFSVRNAEGNELGQVERRALSRLTTHRWLIFDHDGRLRAVALEESTGRAMIRKLTGKFRPDLDSDLLLTIDGEAGGRLIRRANGERGTLQLTRADRRIDERLLVATAALVFGLEP